MRQVLVAQLVGADADYVTHFGELQVLNLEIRGQGPTPERLLKKAILELDVGNFLASVDAGRDAVAMAPFSADTHHILGLAYVHAAFAKAGMIPQGPGHGEGMPESVTGLLWRSLEQFRECLEQAPDDEETRHDVQVLEKLLRANPEDAALLKALQAFLA
jgi:hypothetical protein